MPRRFDPHRFLWQAVIGEIGVDEGVGGSRFPIHLLPCEFSMFTREASEHCRVAGYLRRICDLTSPNLPRLDDGRERIRQNRTLPVLLAPWEDGAPVVAEAATALTKNISDYGVSITMSQPFRAAEVVLGVWLTEVQGYEPWFFRGPIRQNVPIGGGFWGLGIEVVERLEARSTSEVARLLTLAKELLPPRTIDSSRPSELLTARSR